MKKVLKFTLNLFIYFAIVTSIIFGLPRLLIHSLNTPYPMAAITSGSMWPELKEGELIFIQGIGKDNLKIGDIVVYRNTRGDTFTIHRIIDLKESEFITKGDANFGPDAPVTYDRLVGRTFNFQNKPVHIPYLGSITMFASNLKNK